MLKFSSIRESYPLRQQRIFQSIQSRNAKLHLGLSVSRKIGKAYMRNLIKRRIKEMDFATLKNNLLASFTKMYNAKKTRNIRVLHQISHYAG